MPVTTSTTVDSLLPEGRGYRLKKAVLGPPLNNDDLEHEKLSNTTALGVLSSDCISSSAYGTEEILHALLPVLGLAAFGVLLPITFVVLAVLIVVTLTYRQVVMIYTDAGGSYVVARENFGPLVAQVGAVALMLDYIVTVAVQASAGTAALTSAVPVLVPYSTAITVGVVALLAYGNLRGVREAGRAFAFPTYFFVGSMAVVILLGLAREFFGDLPVYDPQNTPGVVEIGTSSPSLMSFAAMYVMLKAFANGGSSLTGLEAISNGVSAFHAPRGRNARRTLVRMSVMLGTLVLGVSWLAHVTHAVPYAAGSPTVISQVAKAVFPDNALGSVLFLTVQLATMLILYTGANTPFNGFPFLVNFVATDGFVPRWLRKRGHRLAFSNGILTLAVVSLALILTVGAHVDKLVAFYAIGVFTGFTLAGFGMVRYNQTHREPGWRRKVVVNAISGAVSALVVVIFAWTKFHEGAWLVVVMFAVLVPAFFRLHRIYEREREALATDPSDQPLRIASHNVAIVFVDNLDLATIGAIRHAHSIRPSELRCVHFVIDRQHASDLQDAWDRSGFTDLALELIDCPDRRLDRAAANLTSEIMASDLRVQVTALLPQRAYGSLIGRLLHDRTAEHIATAVTRVPGAAAMVVPFEVSGIRNFGAPVQLEPPTEDDLPIPSEPSTLGARSQRIGQVPARTRAVVRGRITSMRTSPIAGSPSLRIVVADPTGSLTAVFYGQRQIVGLEPGAVIEVEGRVIESAKQRYMANPTYAIIPRTAATAHAE